MRMKIRNAALNTLFYFLYMFGACFAVMLVESLLVFIVNRFVYIPYLVLTVIRIVIYTLGVIAIIAAIGYFEGYREGVASVGETVLGGALALIPYILFGMLFKFQAFVTGAVRFTAGLIHNGTGITAENLVEETPYSRFLLTFLVYGALYIATLTVTRYFGAQRRIVDRAELRRNETDTDRVSQTE